MESNDTDFITGEGRALFNSVGLGKMIVVIADTVYTCEKDYCLCEIGRLLTKWGRIYIEENDSKLIAILDNIHIYIYDYSKNTFAKIDPYK